MKGRCKEDRFQLKSPVYLLPSSLHFGVVLMDPMQTFSSYGQIWHIRAGVHPHTERGNENKVSAFEKAIQKSWTVPETRTLKPFFDKLDPAEPGGSLIIIS